jgi:catechol 2,3-dioxygenase-like lactoylglutathione lyase family enzyme
VAGTRAAARGIDRLFMSIKSLAHVCIKSANLDATTAFYCGELGMKRLFDFTRQGKVIGFYMKADNTSFIEVFEAGEVTPIEQQVLNHLCLETDDIVALQKTLAARGLQPGEVKMGADNSYQFWMKDPNGMSIEFHQYTDKSSQFTGEPVEVNW